MKHCNRCKQTLPKEDFTPSKSRYDGLQSYCRECMKKYRIEHYQNNKSQYYARNEITKATLKQFVVNYKNNNSCVDCKITYVDEPWLLEFDHLDDTKLHNISQMWNRGSLKLLKAEIDKCDLVCVVCHRRRTAKRGEWKSNFL